LAKATEFLIMKTGVYVKSIAVLHVSLLGLLLLPSGLMAQPPWDVNTPIVSVDRQLYWNYYTDYDKTPPKNYAPWIGQTYVGPGLQREETKSWMGESDTPFDDQHRFSWDNGQTWTSWTDLPPKVTQDGPHRIFWAGVATTYDSTSGKAVSVWLRQTGLFKTDYYNHTFIRTSDDYGQTWGDPQQLMYEAGAEFDPADPYNTDYLENNKAYPGYNVAIRQDGSLLLSAGGANIPDDIPQSEFNPYNISVDYAPPDARGIGGIDFVGNWNSDSGEYDWSSSNVAWVPRHVSSRGLIEPTVAELTNGDLLTVYRDSNASISGYPYYEGGHKRYSLSTDGGSTLSQPLELKYDDGSQFYSPSAHCQLLRHSVTGKLYWFGNINMAPAEGNHYRHPLVIAEVDEVNVALKKDTVTLIGTKQAGEGEYVQLSNFTVLENRQTHQFEIHLTRLGEDPDDTWKANAYKYTLTLMPPKPEDTLPTPVMASGTIPYAWYRVDDTTVVTQVGSDQVAWLQDQTGSRHLAAVGDPQLTDNGIDGRSCVTCEGQDDYMLGSQSEWGEAAPGTVFAVWRRTGTPVNYRTSLYDSNGEHRQFFSVSHGIYPEDKIEAGGAIWNDVTKTWEAHYTGGGVLNDPVGTDQWAISMVSHTTGVTDTIRINGQEFYSDNLLSGGMTGLRLGGFMLDYARHWTGDIAEFIIFEGELTADEIETIELILMVRWGMVTLVPGDTNNDGMVDQQDAEKLVGNWGASVTGGAPEGDFDGDGLVGPTDAVILAAHWGYGTSEANNVPEPSTWVLLAAASLLWIVQRRR